MIPATNGFFDNLQVEEQPNKTYCMNLDNNIIRDFTDGVDAIKQAIFKIVNTERFKYAIYSWDYGIETLDLYGANTSYAMSEIKRRISEALLCDKRIQSVDDFEFDVKNKVITCKFTVQTIYGEVDAERQVKI